MPCGGYPKWLARSLKKRAYPLEAVDLFIPHQANLRINQAFAKALDLPESKVYNNIQRYGNTTAASIPLALDEAIEKRSRGRRQHGHVSRARRRGHLGSGACIGLPVKTEVPRPKIEVNQLYGLNVSVQGCRPVADARIYAH